LPKICASLSSKEDERFLNTQALTERKLRAIASLGTSGGASTLTATSQTIIPW
jgi:hypothetical protein